MRRASLIVLPLFLLLAGPALAAVNACSELTFPSYDTHSAQTLIKICNSGHFDDTDIGEEDFQTLFPHGFTEKKLPDSVLYVTGLRYTYEGMEYSYTSREYDAKQKKWVEVWHSRIPVYHVKTNLNFYVDEKGTIMKCVSHGRVTDTSERDPDEVEHGLFYILLDTLFRWL